MGASLETLRAAARSDGIGEYLGYGAEHRTDGAVQVRFYDSAGDLLAGFNTHEEGSQEFIDERERDYTEIFSGIRTRVTVRGAKPAPGGATFSVESDAPDGEHAKPGGPEAGDGAPFSGLPENDPGAESLDPGRTDQRVRYEVGEVMPDGRIAGLGPGAGLNNQEAREAAAALKFKFTKDPPFNPHGKLVFRKGNLYISPDLDGHNGGVWKMFDHRGKRMGTYDARLKKIAE